MAAKEFIVVGGPNGAGKTTFVEEYLSHHDILYLAADHLAKEINPAAPELVAVAAGRQFVKRISASLSGGESFIVETPLSGKTFRRTLQRAREHGFTITIHFVFNDGPDTSVARVLERVRRGGHNVPEEDIRRRYRRSLVNFWQIYRPLADKWILTYNGSYGSSLASHGTPSDESIFDFPARRLFFSLAGLDENDSPKPKE